MDCMSSIALFAVRFRINIYDAHMINLFMRTLKRIIVNNSRAIVNVIVHALFTEPITTIHGAPDLYIDTGSTVNLTCIVRHLPEPPAAIQWTHNNEVSTISSTRTRARRGRDAGATHGGMRQMGAWVLKSARTRSREWVAAYRRRRDARRRAARDEM